MSDTSLLASESVRVLPPPETGLESGPFRFSVLCLFRLLYIFYPFAGAAPPTASLCSAVSSAGELHVHFSFLFFAPSSLSDSSVASAPGPFGREHLLFSC